MAGIVFAEPLVRTKR